MRADALAELEAVLGGDPAALGDAGPAARGPRRARRDRDRPRRDGRIAPRALLGGARRRSPAPGAPRRRIGGAGRARARRTAPPRSSSWGAGWCATRPPSAPGPGRGPRCEGLEMLLPRTPRGAARAGRPRRGGDRGGPPAPAPLPRRGPRAGPGWRGPEVLARRWAGALVALQDAPAGADRSTPEITGGRGSRPERAVRAHGASGGRGPARLGRGLRGAPAAGGRPQRSAPQRRAGRRARRGRPTSCSGPTAAGRGARWRGRWPGAPRWSGTTAPPPRAAAPAPAWSTSSARPRAYWRGLPDALARRRAAGRAGAGARRLRGGGRRGRRAGARGGRARPRRVRDLQAGDPAASSRGPRAPARRWVVGGGRIEDDLALARAVARPPACARPWSCAAWRRGARRLGAAVVGWLGPAQWDGDRPPPRPLALPAGADYPAAQALAAGDRGRARAGARRVRPSPTPSGTRPARCAPRTFLGPFAIDAEGRQTAHAPCHRPLGGRARRARCGGWSGDRRRRRRRDRLPRVIGRDGADANAVVGRLVDWFRPRGRRPALAAHPRPLPRPGGRGAAPGDARRARAALLRPLHRALAHGRRPGARPSSARCSPSGRASAIRGAPATCTRPPGSSRRDGWPAPERLTDLPGVGAVHRGRDPLLRRRRGRAAGGHQRRARGGPALPGRLARRARDGAGRPARRSWTSAGSGARRARPRCEGGCPLRDGCPAADAGDGARADAAAPPPGALRGLDAPAPRRPAARAGRLRLGQRRPRSRGRGEPASPTASPGAAAGCWCGRGRAGEAGRPAGRGGGRHRARRPHPREPARPGGGQPGRWEFPGGKREPGETRRPGAAARDPRGARRRSSTSAPSSGPRARARSSCASSAAGGSRPSARGRSEACSSAGCAARTCRRSTFPPADAGLVSALAEGRI